MTTTTNPKSKEETTMTKSTQVIPTTEQITIVLEDAPISASYWASTFEMKTMSSMTTLKILTGN
jgi:hypothetical protein